VNSMEQTLAQQAYARNNDYSHLEVIYHQATGDELVRDPYGSVRHPMSHLALSASVIIPVWNEQATIEKFLIAIEQSTFNRKYPGQLEAIVVDDGSNDGTWDLLERMPLSQYCWRHTCKNHDLRSSSACSPTWMIGDQYQNNKCIM
jgi:hypothetical protein